MTSVRTLGVSSARAGAVGKTLPKSSRATSAVSTPIGGYYQSPILTAFMRDETLDTLLFSDYASREWSSTCWARGFDLSGVSWESDAYDTNAMRVTLIGRDCFLTARHYTVPPGTIVTFTDRFGGRFSYEVAAISASDEDPLKFFDGRVGTFTETVSDTLTSYAIEQNPASGDWLLATRSRFSTSSHLPFSQRAMIERITNWSTLATPTSPGARWYPSLPHFSGEIPADVLARWYPAGLYDSSDALFTYKGGVLKIFSTYGGISYGPYYGYPAMLAQVDEFLSAQGTTRLAQAGVPPTLYDFLRPDGVSRYLRPGGTATYKRN